MHALAGGPYVGTDVLYEEAGSNAQTFQGGLKRDCDEHGQLHPKRRAANGRGMRIDDFVAQESARAADLSEAHVVALRLYSTAAFRTINAPLRDQERFGRNEPHPLPLTVAWIRDALGKLRVIEAKSARTSETMDLYRGMAGTQIQPEFLEKGGTELAPMSSTSSLKVAMQYSASEKALIIRIRTKNFMVRGPTISFLSAFPGEEEFLFPPLTCASRRFEPQTLHVVESSSTLSNPLACARFADLQPTGAPQELRVDDATFTVVDVEPTMP